MESIASNIRPTHPAPLRAAWLVICLAIWPAIGATCLAAEIPARFDPARDAARDVAAAVAIAKSSGKRVIVDVGGEWCPWCHVLDRFVAAHPDVAARVRAQYVWVKVNVSKENRNEAFLARWPKVEGYPHFFVLDANGRLLHSQDTSLLEAGESYDKARVLAFLDRWARN